MKFQVRKREDPDINMTSLIDVVLLLLIFFMMSTKFVDEGRLRVRLPEAGVQPDEAASRRHRNGRGRPSRLPADQYRNGSRWVARRISAPS